MYFRFLGSLAFAWGTAAQWQSSTKTFSATTETVTGFTETYTAYTESDYTRPATTIAQPNTTLTVPAETVTELLIPSALGRFPDVLNPILQFAPSITSAPSSALTKLEADLNSYRSAYASAHPEPPILSQALEDLVNDVGRQPLGPGPEDNGLYQSIREDLWPWEPSSVISELAGLVSPYPTLSSELMAYISVAATYEAEPLLAEGSILSKDLGVTAPPPSWITALSDSLPKATAGSAASTSSSGSGAAPTGGAAVVVNAVAAAAGLVGVVLL